VYNLSIQGQAMLVVDGLSLFWQTMPLIYTETLKTLQQLTPLIPES
jgi:hypothetical protein